MKCEVYVRYILQRNVSSYKPLFDKLVEVEEFNEYYIEKVQYYFDEFMNTNDIFLDIEKYDNLVNMAEGRSDPTDLIEFIQKRSIEIGKQLAD